MVRVEEGSNALGERRVAYRLHFFMRYEIATTEAFDKWLKGLKVAVANRLTRVAAGHLGDVKPVGDV